ncbi:MAG: hypothetical protein ACLTX6_00950 [Lachnospiraceae bacterium]
MNKQAALNYAAADAALASVPEDLSIYTDETAKAVTAAANALKGKYKAIQQSDVDTLVTALTDAVKALRKKAVSLTVTNKTGMFNVTDAVLDNDKLIVTLHGNCVIVMPSTRVLMKKLLQMGITETNGLQAIIPAENGSLPFLLLKVKPSSRS